MIELTLPYPPSVNHYWTRTRRGGMAVSTQGRFYREHVTLICRSQRIKTLAGRLSVSVILHPPDKRKRDVDNAMKGLLDSLVYGGVYEDDSQIDVLTIQRLECMPGGKTVVTITEV